MSITRVSTTTAGGQANGSSYLAGNNSYIYGIYSETPQVFSADGTQIVFSSTAPNLTGGAANGVVLKTISGANTGQEAPELSGSYYAQFSRDGSAQVLSNGQKIVEIRGGATTTVAAAASNHTVLLDGISSDGNRIAYANYTYHPASPGSGNPNGPNYMPPTPAYSTRDSVVVKDLSTSVKTTVNAASSARGFRFDDNLDRVVFNQYDNSSEQVLVENVNTGAAVYASATQGGVTGDQNSTIDAFSHDGSEVAFTTNSSNLDASALEGGIFVKHLGDGSLDLAAANHSTATGGTSFAFNDLSNDGSELAFTQTTLTGVNGSGNGTYGTSQTIQIRDLTAHVNTTITPTPVTGSATIVGGQETGFTGSTFAGVRISPDGLKVAYTEVTQTSGNLSSQTFVYDTGTQTTTAVSSVESGFFINNLQFSPDSNQLAFSSLSTDGLTGPTTTVYDLQTNVGETVPAALVHFSPDSKTFAYATSDPNQVPNDTNSSSDVFVADAVCFASGTLIRTVHGEVAVEALNVGDLVVTSSGAHRPIRWLGHRTMDCRRHPDPVTVRPVRIAAHAFGPNKPMRDLFLSPGHSICFDVVGEVLMPAVALVNGATIAQVEVEQVTYWHVELDTHDVILAENLACESYLDMDNRGFFAESEVVALDLKPDADAAQRTHADYCRPFHIHGSLVEAVRAQIGARAAAQGWRLSNAIDTHLEIDGRRIEPMVRDQTIRFLVPAGAEDIWLVSPAVRPCDSTGSEDARRLGLDIGSLRIEDGLTAPRAIALDDPLLDTGFSRLEDDGTHRWTDGRARLPADLWESCPDAFFLRIDLASPPVARWVVPETGAGACDRRCGSGYGDRVA